MVDIDDLVETYKKKVAQVKEAENYKLEIIEPEVARIFDKDFMQVFQNIADAVNHKVNSNVINFKTEGKNRFSIEGRFHRITFQKGKIETIDRMVNVNIIPLCVWKGVTKHLGPISFIKNLENNKIEWDLPATSVEEYTKRLFRKLAEDEDFYM